MQGWREMEADRRAGIGSRRKVRKQHGGRRVNRMKEREGTAQTDTEGGKEGARQTEGCIPDRGPQLGTRAGVQALGSWSRPLAGGGTRGAALPTPAGLPRFPWPARPLPALWPFSLHPSPCDSTLQSARGWG